MQTMFTELDFFLRESTVRYSVFEIRYFLLPPDDMCIAQVRREMTFHRGSEPEVYYWEM
jgi:hypothetical protein